MGKICINSLLRSIDESFIIIDSSLRILDLSVNALNALNFNVGKDSIGQELGKVFPSADETGRLSLYREVLQTGSPLNLYNVMFENKSIRYYLHIRAYRVDDYLCILFKNVTSEHEKDADIGILEKELNKLNILLQNVREEERKIISREIHDYFGQELTGFKFDLAWIKKNLYDEQFSLLERMDEIISRVDQMVTEVKELTAICRLDCFEDHSLHEAINKILIKFNKATGLEPALSFEESFNEIGHNQSIVLLKILQESLTNIARHAEAAAVKINYSSNPEMVCLEIIDDGIGIKKRDLYSPSAYGIIGMRERCRNIGGTLKIWANDNGGTTVKVMIPPIVT